MKDKITPEDQAVWDALFKPILYDKKGLNKTKVIKLLLNHHRAVQEIIRVYHHVTNGTVTDILTPAAKMIEIITEITNQNLANEKNKWTKEHLSDNVTEVNDTCLVRRIAQLNQHRTTFEVTLPQADKYNIVWDNRDSSIMCRPNKALPVEWFGIVSGACLNLHSNLNRNELMVTK